MDKQNKKENQGLAQLTQKEFDVYKQAETLRKEKQAAGVSAYVVGVLGTAPVILELGRLYMHKVAEQNQGDWTDAIIPSVWMTGLVLVYGFVKKQQGITENKISELKKKREYKRAEQFMKQKYNKGEQK